MAVLEQELTRSTQELVSTINDETDENLSSSQGTSGLSLIRLRVWMQEPMERFIKIISLKFLFCFIIYIV